MIKKVTKLSGSAVPGTLMQANFSGPRNDFAKTPKALYDKLHAEFDFGFDPCPPNPTFNGLDVPWYKNNFVNPPYSDIRPWLEKALNESLKRGCHSVVLVPARTDVRWFHDIVLPHAQEVRFIKGRVTFMGYDHNAPFACMLVIFNENQPGYIGQPLAVSSFAF